MTTATKTVQIIARVQFKNDARKVVYLVRGSKGEQYETYMFDGKATSCTCPAHKPCYHMSGCEQKESERVESAETVALAEKYIREDLDDDAKYEAWKAQYSLDNTLSREAYVACFDPCGMEV